MFIRALFTQLTVTRNQVEFLFPAFYSTEFAFSGHGLKLSIPMWLYLAPINFIPVVAAVTHSNFGPFTVLLVVTSHKTAFLTLLEEGVLCGKN